MKEIYLDNNATTSLAPEVLDAMLPYYKILYGNPSSLHKKGIEAERAIKSARQKVADSLHVKSSEIYFTSGATEADNWAIKNIAKALKKQGKHIITTKVEHEAVLESCRALEVSGYEITYLDIDEFGQIKKNDLISAIRKDTILVAIMHVNNELGTIYPINSLAKEVKNKNKEVVFFSDGAQALGKLNINLQNIDLYSVSAHKIHGPKGVGALFVRSGINLPPFLHGGGQESGMRGGTENVAGIVGFGKAVEISYENLEEKTIRIKKLRKNFIESLKEIPDVRINSPEDALPNILNVAFKGIPAETFLHTLEAENIYVSVGSACSTKRNKESHVLEAIKIPKEYQNSSLRFGFSRFNTEREIDFTGKALKNLAKNLRRTIDS